MPELQRPRALPEGGRIGVAAPGFAVDEALLAQGIEGLAAAGFRVQCRDDVRARCGYLAGDDARRAAELMELIADPEVDAVVCARGGYGCQRILPFLEPGLFRAARKPLLGYSDVTVLHLWQLRNAGLVGLHAPMLDHGAWSEDETRAVRSLVGGGPSASGTELLGKGHVGGACQGTLVGGSLTMLAASLGTSFEVDTRGAILLFEEVGERPYALDRLLHQLAAAGKLSGIVGVGVGHLARCVDPKRSEPTAEQVILEILLPLGVPLVLGLPFGHGRPNLPWPVGVRGALDGERGVLTLLEAAVES